MKLKYFICCFFLIVSGNIFSQKVGLHAGYSLSYPMYARFSNDLYRDTRALEGFDIGLNLQIPLSNVFSLGTGLSLIKKGLYYHSSYYTKISEEIYKIYYLQIPLTLRASHNVGKTKIYAEGGLYGARGLVGTYRLIEKGYYNPQNIDDKIRWDYDTKGSLKRYDYGVTSGLGIIFKSFQLGLNYEIGLTDIMANNAENYSYKNSVFIFSIGYTFN